MSRRAPKGVFWLILLCVIATFGAGCSRVKVVTAKCAGPSFAVKEVVTVKKDKHIIVWASDAKNLEIKWKATNPYSPKDVRCDGDGYCAVLVTAQITGTYPYTIKGTCNGAPAEKDPQVEIIDH